MKLADFDYELPEELIAQAPCEERDRSRLLVVHRDSGRLEHRTFSDFPEYLRPGDAVVVNDSRVIPARLFGSKESGGRVEFLLLSCEDERSAHWTALLKPGRRVKAGTSVRLGTDAEAEILEKLPDGTWRIRFRTGADFNAFLNEHGYAPLPPYIKRRGGAGISAADLDRYQTVYARVPGSVAAPTAGLHFTPAVLDAIRSRGIPVAAVTLHVGYGTFRPIEAASVEDHVMDEERIEIGAEAARTINAAARVVAVGTTSTRTIETAAGDGGAIAAGSLRTRLYLYPGRPFRRVGALLTNFHLPRSSLFLLVCAFAGRERMMEAYAEAVRERYRFFSYGDCMLIL
ncbi:MAG TPA: tRNA preQ1(34) S-adenosylmethionine ribosyltransferase-isomerase QueA [Syntrophales bacterium]|nr:tRNA preQ1(34) S-adenosylmethionine ribosyltransferase-isomerase QueA [Syntrophales bacterium]